ncbi:hypothetical protein PV08_00492 [Exophiala spinifera]|uniref:Uncharacterized protein n=1 Tax=Exophiala spinifera TaxID=91928 RepID=A0A0D2A543_9EURO|nr:uncharacterized protein PV08_00492 [Exophiala spinifera]KIW19917.1 hypothetical protein PV08_00492 [Exophiala spinifera]
MSSLRSQEQNDTTMNDEEDAPNTRSSREDTPLFFPSPSRDEDNATTSTTTTAAAVPVNNNDEYNFEESDAKFEREIFISSYAPSASVPIAASFSSADLKPYRDWDPQTTVTGTASGPTSSSTVNDLQLGNYAVKRKREWGSSTDTDTSDDGGALLSSFARSSGLAPRSAPPACQGVEIIVIDSSDDSSAAPAPAPARGPARARARARAVAPAPANDDDGDDGDSGSNTSDSSTTSGSSTGSAWDQTHGMKPWPGMTTRQQLSLMDRQKYFYGQEGTPLPPNRPYKPSPNLGDVVRKAEKRKRRAKRAALKAAKRKAMARK